MTYLDFEKEIEQLDKNLDALKNPYESEGISSINQDKITDLQSTIDRKIIEIYSNLNSWQKTKVARHEKRPRSDYYIKNIFQNFQLISGDRYYAEDESVITGFAKLDNMSVLVIGQEKGYDTESRIKRNFGMMRPEGYRKCMRLMKTADKFNIPIISFIDTPGAYPGKGAEERGQAEAIASSIDCCLSLNVPTISIIIGEGFRRSNSPCYIKQSFDAGALYIFCNFSEGCASILWKDVSKSNEAAEAMKITAQDLFKFNIIDEIIKEPTGGAQRDPIGCANSIKSSLLKYLEFYNNRNDINIRADRKEKFMKIGKDLPADISFGKFNKDEIIQMSKNKKIILISILIITILGLFFYLN